MLERSCVVVSLAVSWLLLLLVTRGNFLHGVSGDLWFLFIYHDLVKACSEEQVACFFFPGPLSLSLLLKWCCDVVCHLIGFIHFIFCTSVYSVFSLLLSLYSSSSFFFISASAAVFKLHLLLWGSAEPNLSLYYTSFTLCPNAAALWHRST